MIFRVISDYVLNNLIKELKSKPLGYEVNIYDLKRSSQANALYWKWVTIIGHELGYHPDEMHEALKRNFIGVDQGVDYFGNLYLKPKSSAKLKKKEFSEYMNKVHAFAMSQGINLPQPDYYGLENY